MRAFSIILIVLGILCLLFTGHAITAIACLVIGIVLLNGYYKSTVEKYPKIKRV